MRKRSPGRFGTDQKASAGQIRRRFLVYDALRGGSARAVGHAIVPPTLSDEALAKSDGGRCVPVPLGADCGLYGLFRRVGTRPYHRR